MAKEIQAQNPTGLTLYALLFSRETGQVWNGAALVTPANAIDTYAINLTEEALLTTYTANFPALITTPGLYRYEVRKRVGATRATTDPAVWFDDIEWDGAKVATPVKPDAAGRVTTTYGLHKNTAFNNFEFPMTLATNHVTAATGKTVTGTVSIDGATDVALTNSGTITEIGVTGKYKINLSAADLNGRYIVFTFTATGCDPTVIGLVMQD